MTNKKKNLQKNTKYTSTSICWGGSFSSMQKPDTLQNWGQVKPSSCIGDVELVSLPSRSLEESFKLYD